MKDRVRDRPITTSELNNKSLKQASICLLFLYNKPRYLRGECCTRERGELHRERKLIRQQI